MTSLLAAKIEDNKEEIASQQFDDNSQTTQSSDDLFHPYPVKDVKESKSRPKDGNDLDSDSKESTEIQAEVVFETVPASVDPDSTEGNIFGMTYIKNEGLAPFHQSLDPFRPRELERDDQHLHILSRASRN